MSKAIRMFAFYLLFALTLHKSEAQEFPQYITDAPFTAVRTSIGTDAKGQHVTFGIIARRSDGSVYYEMTNQDGKGTVIIWDMTQHRGIELYPFAHMYTIFSAEIKPQIMTPGYSQSFMSSVEAPGTKRTDGEWETTGIGVREIEGVQTVGHSLKTNQGRTYEHWYSPVLGFNVESKGYQPENDLKSEMHIQQIRLGEPDAKLFEIPEGYVQEKKNAAIAGGTTH